MKKRYKVLTLGFFIITLIITLQAIEITSVKIFLNGKDVDETVMMMGLPNLVTAGDHVEVEVTVKGEQEEAWVGATLIDPEGDELDFDVQWVSCYNEFLGFSIPTTKKVRLSTTITEEMDASDLNDKGLQLIVRLWKRKVPASECTHGERTMVVEKDGSRRVVDIPCKYCQRNGYHMEIPIGSPYKRHTKMYYYRWSPY